MSDVYVGEIRMYGFSFPPRGFATCSGQIIGISQNAALFSLLGTNFGGNGQTTFQLPNLASRLAIGQGQSPGLSNYVIGEFGGTESVLLTSLQMPIHTHSLTGSVSVATAVGTVSTVANQPKPGGNLLAKASDAATSSIVNTYSNATTDSTLGGVTSTVTNTLANSTAGSGQPFSILQPFLTVNYSIATAGVFPSRN